jgi:hypothetical protein
VTPSSCARFASPSAGSAAVLASSGGFLDDFAFVLWRVCENKKREGVASVRGSAYPKAPLAASHERKRTQLEITFDRAPPPSAPVERMRRGVGPAEGIGRFVG